MSELVTEARVERCLRGVWAPFTDTQDWRPVPEAVELGRMAVHNWTMQMNSPMPIRVVDSAGKVVQQWGRP